MARQSLAITLTETGEFRRLVTMLEDVERHADDECDVALQEIARDCRTDLAELQELG